MACLTFSLPASDPGADGHEADGGHWDGRVVQNHHEDSRGEHRAESQPEYGSLRRGAGLDPDSKRPVLDAAHDGRGDDQRSESRRPHVGKELPTVEMEVSEHDQVGQVGAGQEQRPGVGEEEAAVEQRGFALTPASRRIDQDRGEEGHRGVEVQHGRHHRPPWRRPHEQDHAARRRTGQPVAHSGEQAVVIGDQTDQQQPGNEDERRPVLGGRRAGRRRMERGSGRQPGEADTSQGPPGEMLTAVRRYQGRERQ